MTDRLFSKAKKPFIKKIKNDTGISANDFITGDATPTIVGKAKPKSKVKVIIRDADGNKIDTIKVKADKNGKFKIEPDSLPDDTYTLTIKAKKNGKTKKANETVIIDSVTETPIVKQVYNNTQDPNTLVLTFVGAAEAGATISLFSGNTQIGSAVAGTDGTWTIGFVSDPFDTRGFGVHSEDIAGNNASTARAVDAEAPEIVGGQSFAYNENRAAGATLGTVAASDNIGVADFAIVGGNGNGWFAIDTGGQISLTAAGAAAAANNWEWGPNGFTLTVRATDPHGNTVAEDVDLMVRNLVDTSAENAALAEVYEDSSSDGPGNAGSNNGLQTTDDQLSLLVDRVLDSANAAIGPMEKRYQDAIEAEVGFTNLPTLAEVQALVDEVNSDLTELFADETTFNEPYVMDWDVSLVENTSGMFKLNLVFDQDIGGWDVSNVTDMSSMFSDAEAFNQNIGAWDVGNVETMSGMFSGARAFNQDVNDWDVSQVTDMSSMFLSASTFNQDIDDWNVSGVSSMSDMFRSADVFDRDIGGWAVGNVTDMSYMFFDAAVFNRDLNDWNVVSVTDMNNMFAKATAFNQNIGDWNVSAVIDMNALFLVAEAFNQDIGDWNVGNAQNMRSMFRDAKAFDQDIGGWEVANVTDMGNMFTNAVAFDQDIGDWDVDMVLAMDGMFANATAFNQYIGDWEVGQVTDMGSMFSGTLVFDQDIGDWDVSSVQEMSGMFNYADAFNQDIAGWDVGSVKTMANMFAWSSIFDQDISGWDISALTLASGMFDNSVLSTANYDLLLAGWAVLDTVSGETKINANVDLGASGVTFSDATSKNHLEEVYNWTVGGNQADKDTYGRPIVVGDNVGTTIDESLASEAQVIHALDGPDMVFGGVFDDIIVGGEGNDDLTGNAGGDTFVYKFDRAGADTITDFGNGADVIDVRQMLLGYEDGVSDINDYVTLSNNSSEVRVIVDKLGPHGTSPAGTVVTIDLIGVAFDDVKGITEIAPGVFDLAL